MTFFFFFENLPLQSDKAFWVMIMDKATLCYLALMFCEHQQLNIILIIWGPFIHHIFICVEVSYCLGDLRDLC